MGQRRRIGLTAGWAIVAVVAAAVALVQLGSATAAPSIIPGTYTITITGGDGAIGIKALTIGPACSNGSDDDLDTKIDHPADPECASPTDSNEGPDNTPYEQPTFTVDIDAAGNVSAPASNVHWQNIWQRQDTGVLGIKDLLIQFVADNVDGKSVTGHLDAATGKLDLTWRFHIQTAVSGVPGTVLIGTPVQPLSANLSTDGTGGAAFDPESLSATLVDSTIVYPAAACANNPLLCPTMITTANSQLGLPTQPGQSTLSVSGTVDRNPIQDDTTPPEDSPDLKLTKTHTGDFTVGTEGPYTLTVDNVGTAATSGQVVVGDELPEGMTLVEATGDGWVCAPADTRTVGCTTSEPIAPGNTAPPITVKAMPLAAGTLVNQAFVTVAGDADAGNDNASDATTVIGGTEPGEPDLTLAKSHTGDFVVGTGAAYTLTVSNVGTAASSGTVAVSDPLPAAMTYVSASGTGWDCTVDGQDVACTSASAIAPGASAAPLTVAVMPTTPGAVTNTATVSGGGQTNNLNDAAADDTTIAEAAPEIADLTLAKSHTGDFTAGTDATYTLTVSNIGSAATAGDVVVTDTLPESMTFVSASGAGWGCSATGQDVSCTTSAVIGAGASGEALQITVAPNAAGSYTNVASVSGGGEENTLNDGAADPTEVISDEPGDGLDVDVALTHTPERFTQGTEGTYVVRVGNAGTQSTAGTVTMTDTMPDGLDLVRYHVAAQSGWGCVQAAAALTCTSAAEVEPGAAYPDVEVVVRPTKSGTITNTATVALEGDTDPTNDSASDPTEVDPAPAPNLAVDVTAPAMVVGTSATIAVEVSNVGKAPTSGPVNLAVPLPATFAVTSATGNGWSCSNAGTGTAAVNVVCTTETSVVPGGKLPVVNLVVTPKEPGTFEVGAKVTTTGDVSNADDTKVVEVQVAASGSSGGSSDKASEMPFTGGDLGLLVTAAAGALGAGGTLVGVSRRRRRR